MTPTSKLCSCSLRRNPAEMGLWLTPLLFKRHYDATYRWRGDAEPSVEYDIPTYANMGFDPIRNLCLPLLKEKQPLAHG